MLKIDGHLFLLDKDHNEFKIENNNHSVDDFSFQRAMQTTFQTLYDKGLFDSYPNADEVSKDFLFTTRRKPDLLKVNDVIP